MKKNKIKVYLLALGAILFIVMSWSRIAKVQASAVSATEDEYYLKLNAEPVYDLEEKPVTKEITQILISAKDGTIDDDLKITWVSSDPEVVSIEKDPSGEPHIAMLKRKAPGYAMITAVIKNEKNGNISNLSCNIKVELEIDTVKSPPLTQVLYNDHKVLVLNKNDSRSMHLKYVSSSDAVVNTLVNWKSSKEDVATVNADGVITAVGAGATTITITTKTVSNAGMPQTLTVDVVVVPTADDSGTMKSDFTITNGKSNDIIKTNAARASYIVWKVYDSNKKLLTSGDELITYTVRQNNNEFVIDNVKAGTYDIYGFIPVDGYADEGVGVPYLHIKYIVPIDVDLADLVMNIGDTANLFKSSNLPSSTNFTYSILDSANPDTGKEVIADIIDFNSTTGLITAQTRGIAFLHFVTPKIGPIKITVIDGISLNRTKATIYTGGTLKLEAKSSYPSIPITWKSSNESVASFKDGLLVGKAPGTTTVTATQTINGVIKTASCVVTVQPGVSSITIFPDDVTMDVGELKTLKANTVPADLSDVSLKWVSSDTTVVDINKSQDLTAIIEGIGGGTAVVFAINQDNVIVGFCKVTVTIEVEGITLSETSVTATKTTPDLQLRATVKPTNATNQTIKWTSMNPSVATVSSTGLVKFVGPGVTSIVATSVSNPEISAVCNVTVETAVATIVLDQNKKTMYVDESTRLTYYILPANASSKEVTWTSSNTAVVTVDATGLLKAKKAGEAVITVKTKDGTLSQSCTVTVVQKAKGITLDVKDLQLNVNQTYAIKVTFTPADSTETALTWESSDKSIATVDASGKVTGVAVGKTVIIAKTASGGTVYCNVTVTEAVTGVKLNFDEKTLVLGEKFKLTATVTPSTASNLGVTWKVSNPKVLSIAADGTIKALAKGAAVVTCTTKEGKFIATCVVQVIEPITNIKLNKTSLNLGLGKSYTLKATITSNAASNPKLKWTSSNKSIATVNSKGKVIAKKTGYVTITARAQDMSGEEASCEVRVVKGTTSISLNRNSLTLVEGRSYSLKATIKPKNATYKTANWKSSNEEVAIVAPNGKVTALAEGKTIITASAKDSSGKVAKCHVVVKKPTPASNVMILNDNLTMIAGEVTTLQKAISPAGSTDRFTWESDNKSVATVNKSTGKVTARTPGIANVTIMTESGKTATTKVTIVGLNTKSITLEQYSQYPLEVIGIDAFDTKKKPTITWQAANSEIAVVNNGLVESRRTGTTTITAIVNGRRLTCKVKVVKIK